MLQIVLGIIAIGLTLYFWERFPSFKWVLATIVAIPLIGITVFVIADNRKKNEREKEELHLFKQQEKAQEEEDRNRAKNSYDNLSQIAESIKIRIKENAYMSNDDRQQDIDRLQQFEIWMNEAKAKAQKSN